MCKIFVTGFGGEEGEGGLSQCFRSFCALKKDEDIMKDVPWPYHEIL